MRALKTWLWVAALGVLSASMPGWSAEIAGVDMVEKAKLAGQDVLLSGAAIRTRAFFKVYVVALYVPQKATSAQAALSQTPRRIEIVLLRNVSADRFVDALNEGLRDNSSPAELDAIAPQVDQLTSIIRAFKEARERDVVTLDYVDNATLIGFKGENRGSIAGEAFNRALMRIWLGDKPVQADIKKALLGG
jgi:hypothetical protein